MSTRHSLAVYRYQVKRSAANYPFVHFPVVPKNARKLRKEAKSPLQEIFIRRVWAELDARGLTPNALAQRVGGPAQKTLDDALKGSDPRLLTVFQTAQALGVQPCDLLQEQNHAASVPTSNGKVHQLPSRYPPIFKKPSLQGGQRSVRKKR